MRYILDTHTLIWYFEDNSELSFKAKSIIEDIDNEIFVSMASLWEIGIKVGLGKLIIPFDIDEIMARIRKESMNMITIDVNHVKGIQTLPHHHRDPFDRMIIAQAKAENCTVITRDAAFDAYDVPVLW